MTKEGKLPMGQILALATSGLFGSMAVVGLINTARWVMALPPEADLSTLPVTAFLIVGKLALQFLAGLLAFPCILYGSRKVASIAAISAIGLLLVLHAASWILGPQITAGGLLAKYGLRVGSALWLLFVLMTLLPNRVFKDKALRTSS
jgi:hypothetical protein